MQQTTAILDARVRRIGAGSGHCGRQMESISSLMGSQTMGSAAPPESLTLFEHCGFKRILFCVEADDQKRLLGLNAVIDIYYIEDSTAGEDPVKIGRVSYWGKLVPGPFAKSDPKWSASITASCLYNEQNADELPELVQEVGPGAFMTMVTQTMFGTSYGHQILGLDGYVFPKDT